jgi:hypothetical protein
MTRVQPAMGHGLTRIRRIFTDKKSESIRSIREIPCPLVISRQEISHRIYEMVY